MTPQARLGERTRALEALFAEIAVTRMAGVPVLHRGLRVEAVDFALHAADEPGALGVLLTPWFMNLVWFPLERHDHPACVGLSHTRAVGGEAFEFIGGHEAQFGSFGACSLFSPMFQFADHAAARATAAAVLASLRAHKPAADEKPPPRRTFLFGRSAVAGPSA